MGVDSNVRRGDGGASHGGLLVIIEQTFAVRASREATAAFFLDIDRVSRCVPGVEGVRQTGPGRYAAVMGVKLGPIRAAFQGAIALDDTAAPARLTASGEGRDRATGSVAKVGFTADLREEQPGVTTVQAVADVALRGRMAQFGTGVMRAAAGELVQEFVACANASLAAPEKAPAGASVQPAPQPAASRPLIGILARGLLTSVIASLRNLAARVRDWRSSVSEARR